MISLTSFISWYIWGAFSRTIKGSLCSECLVQSKNFICEDIWLKTIHRVFASDFSAFLKQPNGCSAAITQLCFDLERIRDHFSQPPWGYLIVESGLIFALSQSMKWVKVKEVKFTVRKLLRLIWKRRQQSRNAKSCRSAKYQLRRSNYAKVLVITHCRVTVRTPLCFEIRQIWDHFV